MLGLNRTIYALKRVRFQNKDQEVGRGGLRRGPYAHMLPLAPSALLPYGVCSRPALQAVKGFIDEISLLRQLRGKPNIIQLIDAQVGSSRTRHPRARWAGTRAGLLGRTKACSRAPCRMHPCASAPLIAFHVNPALAVR